MANTCCGGKALGWNPVSDLGKLVVSPVGDEAGASANSYQGFFGLFTLAA
jgi:hypothetical protein